MNASPQEFKISDQALVLTVVQVIHASKLQEQTTGVQSDTQNFEDIVFKRNNQNKFIKKKDFR